ncbi:hypothetical protein SELMODRAFT_416406 [Selaginella moellendorffii]|uniref:Pentacotripeptide-repeat region of PRORP domain-containing protein n=1 Tax=Selaginella moellendorffii TaxID=88036 RepID=D8RZ68_SELML|nr:hypothetical protein SELMODRAFT_416406 [Selaginella moellendorffii]
MAIRDQMSWAAMITAGAESDDRYEEGLDYYRRMLLEGGMLPDAHILSSVLCCVETLPEARKIHDQVVSSGLYVDVVVMTGLINAYRRCGRLDLAGEVFDRVEFKDMVLWTSMLSAYSHSTDEAVEGLRIFWKMELEGIRPDKVTFTSLITATGNALCGCYAKLVDDRVRAHGLEKDVTIASAMLYMHGKILRACKNAKDVKRGSRLARAALETYPEKSGPYVMLSQIEAEIQELEKKVAEKNGCEEEKKANSFFDCLQPAVLCACANR